ncbi:MAG: hypothetical protein ACK5MN_03410 [Lachnospiraceae bacterium]
MKEQVLSLLKARKGISTDIRDVLLLAIISGIISDIKYVNGIELDESNAGHTMLVLDWATWKYDHPEDGAVPRSIQYRLHNLIIKKAGEVSE